MNASQREARLPVANMGGGRTRREVIHATLLGHTTEPIKCPRTRTVGFGFEEGFDVLSHVNGALARLGLRSPEELRHRFKVPEEPCVVIPSVAMPPRVLATLSDEEVLAEALVLGLCTKAVYDPRRPVIWTIASLCRRLDLFDTRGFYALD